MNKLTILTLIISLLFFTNCRKPENIKAKFTVPDITYVENCNPVIFDNRSKAANTYLWDFGDGTTSIEKNPSHLYEKAGIYTVSLIAMNDDFENETTADVTISKPITFEKISGEFIASLQEYNDIVVEPDGSIILVGTGSEPNLRRFDARGNLLWEKTYDNQNSSYFRSIIKTDDNGYMLSGLAFVSGSKGMEKYFVKTDVNGNILWESTLGGSDNDSANGVAKADDGGYVAVGTTFGEDIQDIYISKIDSNGVVVWERIIDLFQNDKAYAISKTSNNTYIISGTSLGNQDLDSGIFILEMDDNGNLLWQRIYKNVSECYKILKDDDDNYIIAGHSNSSTNTDKDVYLFKINSTGDVIWEKNYLKSGDDVANSMDKSLDGGYLVSGFTTNTQQGDRDAFLLKVDYNGNIIFHKTYGRNKNDVGNSIKATEDCGIVIAGYSFNNNSNYYFLKTDRNGNL